MKVSPEKIANVSRRVPRSAGLKRLKGKISNLVKVSMQFNSDLSDLSDGEYMPHGQ